MIDVTAFLAGASPMLAQLGHEVQLPALAGSHLFEEKIDGLRALLGVDAFGNVQLLSRTKADYLPSFPDIELAASTLRGPLVLDGELAMQETDINGGVHPAPFEMVNWRSQIATRNAGRAATLNPARFIAFDMLVHPQRGDIRRMRQVNRSALLRETHLPFGPFEVVQASMDGPALLAAVRAVGGEGVIAKSLTASYAKGRSKAWRKIKNTATASVLVYGFEPSPARALGSVLVAVLAGGTLRVMGKVGSGFTDASAQAMFTHLSAAPSSPTVIEVAHLGLTSTGKLRQPVFKGIRTDVNPLSCTFDQFKETP